MLRSLLISRRQFTQLSAAFMGSSMIPSALANNSTSAKENGFWVPEEREPHLRTFMQWPVSRQVYVDSLTLDMVQQNIADIANTIVEFEPVIMLMDQEFSNEARRKLSQQIEIWDIPTDDLWCRDSGPLFVINDKGEQAVSHMNFNGWGNKQVHRNDGRIAARIAERLGLPLFDNGIVGEPGGIETDGEGTLLAHESCWVNDNRNSVPYAEIEAKLLSAYGDDKMIWAPGVKGLDITDDHIDALARFVKPGHILIQLPESPDDFPPFSESAFLTHDIINAATDARGRKFEITVIPTPVDVRVDSEDFLASYVNYYVCNGAVISAQFGDRETDEEAFKTLAELYPDREVIALNIDPLGGSGGGIHCATQQQPAT